jgi:hypothetical protein
MPQKPTASRLYHSAMGIGRLAFKENASVVVPANMTFKTAGLNRLSVRSRKEKAARRRLLTPLG